MSWGWGGAPAWRKAQRSLGYLGLVWAVARLSK